MEQIKVVCTQGSCPQQGKFQEVDPGVKQAGGAVLSEYSRHSCCTCGMPMTMVQ